MSKVTADLGSRASHLARLALFALPLCFGPVIAHAQAKPQPTNEQKQAALAPAKDGRAAEASGPSTQGTTISALPGMETPAPTAILRARPANLRGLRGSCDPADHRRIIAS